MINRVSKLIVGIVVVFVMFSFASVSLANMPTDYKSTTLTQEQINSVVSLLKSFNVDSTTMLRVQAALNGLPPMPKEPSRDTEYDSNESASKPGGMTSGELPMFKIGDKGDDVKNIQSILIKKGFLMGAADGSFGPKTKDAIMKFQNKMGMNPNGMIDKNTKKLFDMPMPAINKSEPVCPNKMTVASNCTIAPVVKNNTSGMPTVDAYKNGSLYDMGDELKKLY